jgi:3-phosphoshikimate 1-carboxyvinyltransferase
VRPLRARDTDLMAAGLRALGVAVTEDGDDWLVTPGELRGPAAVDAGLAGTVLRFLPPVAALATGPVRLDGDARLRDRPNAGLIAGLRAAGVEIDDAGRGRAPFTVHGTGSVRGGAVTVDASESSQVVSGLLLAAARFEEGLDLTVAGRVPSMPHVEMTVRTLREHGVAVTATDRGWRVSPGPVAALDRVVEPDLSNAAPFLAAALVTGGRVTVRDWPADTTQPGAHLDRILAAMGAEVARTPEGLQVTGSGRIAPLEADLGEVGELTPVLAALCSLADGTSRLTGIAHLRGHETDRLQALDEVLTAVGARVEQLPDGLVITPGPRRPARLGSYADHRMVHAAALLGLAVDGVEVTDPGAVAKTLPDFRERWSALLGEPVEVHA